LLANVGAGCVVVSSLMRAGIFPGHSWIVDLFERATF
jgi:NADH:ubiquinone oxidoreductase subunit 2 (subunit N)